MYICLTITEDTDDDDDDDDDDDKICSKSGLYYTHWTCSE